MDIEGVVGNSGVNRGFVKEKIKEKGKNLELPNLSLLLESHD